MTVLLTGMCMPLAATFGLLLALLRRSQNQLVAWPAVVYIELVRGTPLLVQLAFVYFSLPMAGQWLDTKFPLQDHPDFFMRMLTWDNFWVGVACLAGNYAAYEAEIHRAALSAVDGGQREAALSLGLSERQAFLHIILPQALRISVPPMMNDMTAMLKDCSLLSTISVIELLNYLQSQGRQGNMMEMLAIAALIYLILSLACSVLGRWIERKLTPPGAPELKAGLGHGH